MVAAAVITAAAIAGGIAIAADAIVATAAEQDQQDDDPQTVIAAHTVVIHRNDLQVRNLSGFTPLIPCYSAPRFLCRAGPGANAGIRVVLDESRVKPPDWSPGQGPEPSSSLMGCA